MTWELCPVVCLWNDAFYALHRFISDTRFATDGNIIRGCVFDVLAKASCNPFWAPHVKSLVMVLGS